MITSRIRDKKGIFYVNRDLIKGVKNGDKILNEYTESEKIPISILEIDSSHSKTFIILAGKGALYPWEKGQLIETGFAEGILWTDTYLRQMAIDGMDNSKYQNISVCNSIYTISPDEPFRNENSQSFYGICNYNMFLYLGKLC